MEITTLIPTILSILGAAIAAYAMHRSSRNLKHRLRIEKRLAQYLAAELSKRGIDSKINIEERKLIVTSDIFSEDSETIRNEIDAAVRSAIENLVKQDQEMIINTLKQPSIQGQQHYLKKLINNSLQELSHHKA